MSNPQFQRVKMMFVGGALRVAAAESLDGRHEGPRLRSAGLVQAGVRAAYDPNYTGTFVEMEVGEPPVFIQLPAAILGEGASRLGITP